MSTWKYRYKSLADTKIHKGFLKIYDDDDRLSIINRVQELRVVLSNKNMQFIDAAPIDNAEKTIINRLRNFKKFKNPVRVKPLRRSFSWLFLVFLLLFVLLLLLVNL